MLSRFVNPIGNCKNVGNTEKPLLGVYVNEPLELSESVPWPGLATTLAESVRLWGSLSLANTPEPAEMALARSWNTV